MKMVLKSQRLKAWVSNLKQSQSLKKRFLAWLEWGKEEKG
jgi:hypothetical protein